MNASTSRRGSADEALTRDWKREGAFEILLTSGAEGKKMETFAVRARCLLKNAAYRRREGSRSRREADGCQALTRTQETILGAARERARKSRELWDISIYTTFNSIQGQLYSIQITRLVLLDTDFRIRR